MNNKIKSEKYRKLSVAALVTGIMINTFAGPLLLFGLPVGNFHSIDKSKLEVYIYDV